MEPRIRTPRRAVMAAFALNGVILGTWGSHIPAVVDFRSLKEAALGGLHQFFDANNHGVRFRCRLFTSI